jgi:cytochrome c556
MIGKILMGALFSFITLAISIEVFAQVEKRQSLMKNNSESVKAIKAAVEAKDYATVEAKAKDIMGNADKIVSFFPKGSETGKTKAKPEIWEKPEEFGKAAKNLGKAASELAATAKSGDDAAVTTKVKALGDACGACHKQFRAEKYAE